MIGPMNGGMSFPEAFQYMASRTEKVLYKVMRIFASVYNLFIPGKLFAKILLVANQRTKNTLPKFRFGKVIQVVENGVFSVVDSPKPMIKDSQVNVVFIGRLVDWKAVDIAIKAIAACKENVKLTIVGDGPLRQELTELAEKIAPNKVEFLGLVPHKEIDAVLENADISVLPSVREAGGAVVLEAMSRGLPVIASNWGGPADYITSASGFLVYPKSEEFMIESFANTIDQLAAQPDLRFAIGIKAIEHVKKHFLWETKIKEIIEIYHLALKA
jgi:glycosyltransferase involved in cell wall biosynthesis